MPAPLLTKEELLLRLLKVFRAWGYQGASMSLISKETGLGKASLYHHFPGGKEQMVSEVLEHVGTGLDELIIEPLTNKTSGSFNQRLNTMLKNVDHFYSSGQEACVLESLSLHQGTDVTKSEVKRQMKAWIKAMTQLSCESGYSEKEAKERAEEVMALIQGSLVMARAMGNKSLFARSLSRVPTILIKG